MPPVVVRFFYCVFVGGRCCCVRVLSGFEQHKIKHTTSSYIRIVLPKVVVECVCVRQEGNVRQHQLAGSLVHSPKLTSGGQGGSEQGCSFVLFFRGGECVVCVLAREGCCEGVWFSK